MGPGALQSSRHGRARAPSSLANCVLCLGGCHGSLQCLWCCCDLCTVAAQCDNQGKVTLGFMQWRQRPESKQHCRKQGIFELLRVWYMLLLCESACSASRYTQHVMCVNLKRKATVNAFDMYVGRPNVNICAQSPFWHRIKFVGCQRRGKGSIPSPRPKSLSLQIRIPSQLRSIHSTAALHYSMKSIPKSGAS